MSVWDGEGGAAAMTTSNGECSGDVIPGTGILTNNVLGEDDLHPDGFHAAPPGLRVASMMAPTVVVGPDGATEVVVGSGGSKRIRSAITQVLVHRWSTAGHRPRRWRRPVPTGTPTTSRPSPASPPRPSPPWLRRAR